MKKFYFLVTAIFILMFGTSIEAAAPNQNTPTISGVDPHFKVAVGHSPQNSSLFFVLTIDGSNFSNRAVVKFGSWTITPFLRSPNQLKIRVPFTAIANYGQKLVMVANRPPNGSLSNSYAFQVIEKHPAITSIDPRSTTVRIMIPNNKITIHGRNFRQNSQARYRGEDRTTNFINQNQLEMIINQDDVETIGHFSVRVNSPGNNPPSGDSNVASFRVNPRGTTPTGTPIPTRTPTPTPTSNIFNFILKPIASVINAIEGLISH